jgi:hypothetical protein
VRELAGYLALVSIPFLAVGLLAATLGSLRPIGIRSRRDAALVLFAGVALFVVAVLLSARLEPYR